jgi:hypothetical protein
MNEVVATVTNWLQQAGLQFEICSEPNSGLPGWKVIFPPTAEGGGIVVEVGIVPNGLLLVVPIYLPADAAALRFSEFLRINCRRFPLARVCIASSGSLAVFGHVFFERLSPEELLRNIAAVRDTAREVLSCKPWDGLPDGLDAWPPLGAAGSGPSGGGLPS